MLLCIAGIISITSIAGSIKQPLLLGLLKHVRNLLPLIHRDPRVPHVEEKDDARPPQRLLRQWHVSIRGVVLFVVDVPHLVEVRVVEDEALPLLPLRFT